MFNFGFKSKKESEALNLEFKKVVADNIAMSNKLIAALDSYNDKWSAIINSTDHKK